MSPDNRNVREVVSLGLLRRYLITQGWHVAEAPLASLPVRARPANAADLPDINLFQSRSVKRNVDVFVLSEPGLDDVELIVPRDTSGSDFERRLQGVIVTLSQVEDKDPEQIIELVRSIGYDIVRSRIPDALVMDDSIYLESAKNYINGMKELLAATATTELRPLPFFGRQAKEGLEYSEKCRFGHTYRGSFGFTIESPISAEKTEALLNIEPSAPFERRVIQRLATGIQHVCQAVDTEDVAPIVNGFHNGFSANGCDRFASLIHDTAYSGMFFGFSFSPQWPVPSSLSKSIEFAVGPNHVEMARVAADRLRGESASMPADIFGTVVRLQNEADPSDLSAIMGEGEISVLHAHEIYGEMHVRITLAPAEYLKAVEAHRSGRAVRISGTLVRKGRYWYLNNPSTRRVGIVM
jgi:hypothetical protein